MKDVVTKLLGEEALEQELRHHRDSGRIIFFVSGAFDLLHVGHIRMLQAAADLGDVLAVAVNSDTSVRKTKGPQRPFMSEYERAEIIAALNCVQYVIIENQTVALLLRKLRPHIHAKGRDYSEETSPEAKVDRELSIKMAFVGDEKMHSSSELAARIASIVNSTLVRL